MKAPSIAQRILIVLVATAMLALSGTMAWATVNDFTARTNVPLGVSVVGTDLSGMTETQARAAIESAVKTPLLRPVTVVADKKEFVFDPSSAVTIDLDIMVEKAFAPRRSASYIARLRHDVAGVPLTSQIEPVFSVDQEALNGWLDGVAEQIDRKPVDAKITVVENRVKIRRDKTGRRTDVEAATASLEAAFSREAALAAGERELQVPVKTLKPKVTQKDLGKTIVVDLSERRIRLFDGAKIEITYPCAIGTPFYPTPQGHFEIVQKRYLPTWVNPAPTTWGKDMPKSIPPGPSNPLGTRALNLSASGIRFHGTTAISSVGTAASHGCMRMRMSDIEDFFERVEVGTQVYIVP